MARNDKISLKADKRQSSSAGGGGNGITFKNHFMKNPGNKEEKNLNISSLTAVKVKRIKTKKSHQQFKNGMKLTGKTLKKVPTGIGGK